MQEAKSSIGLNKPKMTVLDKIFKELEQEAIPAEWYAYEIKRTNQIIRANVEPLEQQIKIESDGWKHVSKVIDEERKEHNKQIKELKDALIKYGYHDANCNAYLIPPEGEIPPECNCGFKQILK